MFVFRPQLSYKVSIINDTPGPAYVATDIGSLLIFSCQLQLHVRVQPDAPIMRVHHNSILAVGIIQGEPECLVTL